MKSALFLLSILMILVCGYGAQAASWDYVYVGDKLPDDPALGDDVCGVFMTDGMAVSDICEITGANELHMTDPADKVAFFSRDLDNGTVGTVEARIKVLAQSGASHSLLMGIENDDRAWVDFYPNQIQLEGGDIYSIDMTEYHIVRLTRDGTDLVVYVDGEEVMQGQVVATSTSRTIIIFGAGSTGGTSESYWDYLAYTTSGAYSPSELADVTAVDAAGKLATNWSAIKVGY